MIFFKLFGIFEILFWLILVELDSVIFINVLLISLFNKFDSEFFFSLFISFIFIAPILLLLLYKVDFPNFPFGLIFTIFFLIKSILFSFSSLVLLLLLVIDI